MRTTALLFAITLCATAHASATQSTLMHAPPIVVPEGRAIELVAAVDDAGTETRMVVRYRSVPGDDQFSELEFRRSAQGGYRATIPAQAVTVPGLEYYIAGTLTDGAETLHFASATAPYRVRVEPSSGGRWIEEERRRLQGRRNQVTVSLEAMDFGNRYGNADRFARGELAWTYRLLTSLYAVQLGYGFEEGETPSHDEQTATSRRKGARYGFGGITVRLHESASVSGRAVLGVSRKGFIVGGGGELTLGKGWRSCVTVGAETLQDLGPVYWLRLQWDTVPPFLMGAAIYKSDRPGAALTGGSYIVYDLRYPVTPQLWLGGKAFYGSRDGPGRGGAGLTMALDF